MLMKAILYEDRTAAYMQFLAVAKSVIIGPPRFNYTTAAFGAPVQAVI
jgi:hypothetical protein